MSSNKSGNLDQSLSFDEVSKLFSLPIGEAANILGVCSSVLKKICHENGLVRWPYRKFLAGKSIEEIKNDAARERNKERTQFSKAARHKHDASASSVNTSKLLGFHTMQQEGSRVIQNGRPQQPLNPSLMKGIPTYLDEFKHGFPTNGLSTVSHRWWGGSSPDGNEDEGFGDEAEANQVDKQQLRESADNGSHSVTIDGGKPEGETQEHDIGPQGTGLLLAVRKRAAEEGREALELGVCKDFGVHKLGQRERMLLLRIFNALPSQWSCGSTES